MSFSRKTIIVLGGSGFLGRKICEIGAISGHKMISLSRSGIPISLVNKPWSDSVKWFKFNIFDIMPDDNKHTSPAPFDREVNREIKNIFSEADAVIHSMGILFELKNFPSYKQLLNFPFKASNCSSYDVNASSKDASYERMNRDSALKLAILAIQFPSIKTFAFVSACHDIAPVIPERYINTKIEAEHGISSLNYFRTLIFRPGMMISEDRPITKIISTVNSLFRSLPIIPNICPSWATVEPISTATVARSIISAIESQGPVPSEKIFEIREIKNSTNE